MSDSGFGGVNRECSSIQDCLQWQQKTQTVTVIIPVTTATTTTTTTTTTTATATCQFLDMSLLQSIECQTKCNKYIQIQIVHLHTTAWYNQYTHTNFTTNNM